MRNPIAACAAFAILLGAFPMAVPADEARDDRTHYLWFRHAAYNRTIVAVREENGNASVATYVDRDGQYTMQNFAAKLRTGLVGRDGATRWFRDGHDLSVEDFPGGVEIGFTADGARVESRIAPLMIGRRARPWEGAAAFRVESDPERGLVVEIGGESFDHHFHGIFGAPEDLLSDEPRPMRDLEFEGAVALQRAGHEDLWVAIRSTGGLEAFDIEEGQALEASFDGAGTLLVAWAHSRERALELAELDPDAELARVDEHYEQLLASRISTPSADLDGAFRAAIYNLEYNFIDDYGWNECIHHWLSFWHNQHTSAAEWLGQEDRSRGVNLFYARNLMPSGAAPQFFSAGGKKRDFGGSNQFFAWQARKHWLFTGDREFAAEMGPALDRVIAQTLKEHDSDGNLLIGWGLQIGNQEDFIEFPRDGATPSMELANMFRTRAMLARGVGDHATAQRAEAMAAGVLEALRRELWIPDLGRFGNFRDETGKLRLEGQYHTHLYPMIWDVVDELDAYPPLRHVRDRLQHPDGRVHVSNLFPNHANGTWGMQAGAAQQPWAAKAFSKAGWSNEAVRPLEGIARLVMGPNLRGGWPEVAEEPHPAYFTPPAGLYISSMVEAVFGLRMEAPDGAVVVAPAFPDDWPSARLELPRFEVEFERGAGNELRYHLRTERSLERRVRWSLPPGAVESVEADGAAVPFEVVPGLGRIVVHADIPASTDTRIVIRHAPFEARLVHDGSVAEGDALAIRAEGAAIVAVEDRLGLASRVAIADGAADLRVATGLLAPYEPYGRIGVANAGRRTVFVECERDGTRFWLAADFTVLPRIEAAAAGEPAVDGSEISVPVLVRNNTAEAYSGAVWLRAIRNEFQSDASIPARSEAVVDFRIPADLATLFALGDNDAQVLIPGLGAADIALSVVDLFRSHPALEAYSRSRLVQIPIPVEDTSEAEAWRSLRPTSHGGPMPWITWNPPLQGMEEVDRLASPDLGFEFEVHPGRWVVVGELPGKAHYTLELPSEPIRKLFVLTAGFVDNHDMHARLGTFIVRARTWGLAAKDLHIPGNIDWWDPNGMLGTMNTLRYGRPDRLGLMPLLGPSDGDWNDAEEDAWRAPTFPRPQHWSTSRWIATPNCNFNIIEIDLGQPADARSLSLLMDGRSPGLAIFGVAAEIQGDATLLEGTPFFPPARFRAPAPVFVLRTPADLEGWTLEGGAFSLDETFGVVGLTSRVLGGEQATGEALSPPFVIDPRGVDLVVQLQGGRNHMVDGEHTLAVLLEDAATGELLGAATPPSAPAVTDTLIPVEGLGGREVRLRVVDRDAGASYAWISLVGVAIAWGD